MLEFILRLTYGSIFSTLTCISTGSPATNVTCTVTLAEGDSPIGDPVVQWRGPDGGSIDSSIQQVVTNDFIVSTLEFTPVQTSHGGQYTCQATSSTGTIMDVKILIVQFPPPTLAMSRDPNAAVTLRNGDPLTLTCAIQLDPAVVVSDVVVIGSLGGPGGRSTTRTMSPELDSAGVYRITLDIPSLRATLSDTYTCTATVMPAPGVENVLGSSETHSSLDITVELAVSISVSYIPPPGAELSPNEYRAASGPVTVTCIATGPVSYQWSSTCRDCRFKTANSSTVTLAAVSSGDTGIHTCTATSSSISQSEMFNFYVVGAGIHVFRGASTGDLQVPGSLPDNGIVISLDTAEDGVYFSFVCSSDSTNSNVGMLIGPDGTIVTSGSVFDITHQRPGELRVENTLSQNVLTANDQGVYTCHIPLQSGRKRNIELRDINVGIYPNGFNTPPIIVHLELTYGSISSTLTCISTGSPATTVTWMRDGQPLTLDGSTYQLTQTVANRRLSTYENVLIINRAMSDIVGITYNCTVMNALGHVSGTLIAYPPPTVTISPPEIPVAGESFSLTCTVTLAEGDSLIGDPVVQWISPDGVSINSDTLQLVTNDSIVTYVSTLEFTAVQTSNEGQYTCQATSTAGTIMDVKTLTVQSYSTG